MLPSLDQNAKWNLERPKQRTLLMPVMNNFLLETHWCSAAGTGPAAL